MAKTLVEVLTEQGVELLPSSGGRMVAHCPFHEGDESPSFTVYTTGTYFCFGCKVWGDGYKFLLDRGWTHREAIEYLGEDYRIIRERPSVIKIRSFTEAYKLLDSATEDYHQFLLQSRGALQYVLDRGLTLETIKEFRIGYTDGFTLRINWAADAALAEKIGLISRAGQEMLSHRITIPNRFGEGLVDFLVGRSVVVNEKVKYLGIRLPKPLYGFYDVRHSNIIFIAEGQFDWLTLRQWGYPAVVIGGSHANSQAMVTLKEKKIVIVPDNDTAGTGLAQSLKKNLPQSVIIDYSKLNVKDVSELATKDWGQDAFNSIVKEQVSWLTNISEIVWNQYFQGSTLVRASL